MEFDSTTLVLLRRGPKADTFDDAELERLQAAHLEHLATMRREGKIVSAGPFVDQSDETLRGLCIYACGVDEARELASRDPSVQAGRMAFDVAAWLTPK